MRLDKALEKAIFEFKKENEISPKMWYQIYRLRKRAKGVEQVLGILPDGPKKDAYREWFRRGLGSGL